MCCLMQAVAKGRHARNSLKVLDIKAKVIQAWWRGHCTRSRIHLRVALMLALQSQQRASGLLQQPF